MSSTTRESCRQMPSKNEPDFVTVVSVGSQPTIENFVTVLSIGNLDKDDCQAARETPAVANPLDVHPEEQVEVFRLPGEPLGFGLKFEGGAKNAEKVKRLFVQSCAEQSPASRVKCSWGTIGEGDEVLSIDGVPVTHMSRLDCVRRLKESQLVIKLLVRCRGALRPEVVSAERKTPPDSVVKIEKIPPELPLLPPPVPPRKLRQARGFADGEANPIPARKTCNGSPKSSGSSTQTNSPQSQHSLTNGGGSASNGKSTPQESTNSSPKSSQGSPTATKISLELSKPKQEPPEAMVYLDARSQDGSSTHGSTSDDTGSSMSTVVDRFSMSDRFSTVSTTSTTSGGASDQQGTLDRSGEENCDESRDFRENMRPQSLEHLDQDFHLNSSDYLLKRLANSEAVTHVESRGEAGGIVEKITAVVAPNTVLIEETLTIQPPLSFQDAPLSYGHETRPDLIYTADLAADSSTHFRPIRDEAAIVECVNGETSQSCSTRNNDEASDDAPSLPARNHVNRIVVNQEKNSTVQANVAARSVSAQQQVPMPRDSIERTVPILPPKPLPRKDIKLKRKRPPPPPPPPRREPPPPVPLRGQIDPSSKLLEDAPVVAIANGQIISAEFGNLENDRVPLRTGNVQKTIELINGNCSSTNGLTSELVNGSDSEASISTEGHNGVYDYSPSDSPSKINDYAASGRTNKVLEIIEMKKIKAFGESTPVRPSSTASQYLDESEDGSSPAVSPARSYNEVVPAPREKKKLSEVRRASTLSMEIEESEDSTTGSATEVWQEAKERQDSSENGTNANNSELTEPEGNAGDKTSPVKIVAGGNADDDDDDEDDETYRSLDEIKEDLKSSETNGTLSSSEEDEEEAAAVVHGEGDSTSDDSEDNGDDYYWQSNLATIGEEEETSSLEYTNANKDVKDSVEKSTTDEVDSSKTELRRGSATDKIQATTNGTIGDVTKPECVRRIAKDPASTLENKLETQVNGRMENCGGDQRLPPDGDEFPATYQEFSACTSEQYQYVGGASPRNSPRVSNATSNGAGHVFKETDETSSSSMTTTTTTKKNNTTSTSSSREKSSSYVQTTNVQKPLAESRVSSQYISSSSLKRETFAKQPEVQARDSCPADLANEKKTSASYFVSPPSVAPRAGKSTANNTEPVVVVSEKTFEISSYYTKDSKTIQVAESEYQESVPPPLPLTGPPKIDNFVAPQVVRSVSTDSSPQRKFSLNGDLWRQDDKSERSVRDKIAMFSSQSSLESPLFPGQASPSPAAGAGPIANGRRLSKYKSSEDVFGEEKIQETKEQRNFSAIERTRSSVDLTDTGKVPVNEEIIVEHYAAHRAPSLPKTLPPCEESTPSRASTCSLGKSPTPPAIYQKPTVNSTTGNSVIIETREFTSLDFNNAAGKCVPSRPAVPPRTGNDSLSSVFSQKTASDKDNLGSDVLPVKSARSVPSTLARATSFSGESTYANEISESTSSSTALTNNGQISRTNSLASTFRRNSEDMRRQSLNQLIEQRRKGISKLRGLVIPEKNAVPIDKPITDLPEIKSRDSILLHQVPKASIHDKWGSQSSLASNTSTASLPLKATTSFKMPAPQIISKYSPAFKRKSLAVYGTSGNKSPSGANTPPLAQRASPTYNNSAHVPDPPKSLESICSPTRSDYSFEYVSSTSVSPDTMQNNTRAGQRKNRGDYYDSDNDSAVSSSQSSISRGFSPPTSPVPSERSSISSERSYHTSLIMDIPARNYSAKEPAIRPERSQYLARAGLYNDRAYPSSERSSSGSSSGSSPNPRSPQPDANPRNSHIPQRQPLKRSSSTETNCSSGSSSTLTSGSQTSAESLSRRVLKPQSVEAINRKNILASARCRSGRDLNGSPLIQRKFSDDEEQLPVSGLTQDNGSCDRSSNENANATEKKDVKIAYIEITEDFDEREDSIARSKVVEKSEETKITSSTKQSSNPDLLEASNDLKMWVRSEAKALMADLPRSRIGDSSTKISSSSTSAESRVPSARTARSRSSLTLDDPSASSLLDTWNKTTSTETTKESVESYKSKTNSRFVNEKETVESSVSEDLLTTLTTKSRSRAPINLEDRSFSRASRQMSLEDILVGKTESKLVRTQSVTIESVTEKINSFPAPQITKQAPPTAPRNNGRASNNDSWSEDKSFVSKIPTPGRASKGADVVDESSRLVDKSRVSKIPTQRPLGRRSASVTDMKKALENTETGGASSVSPLSGSNQIPAVSGVHHRFPSLDSSVEQERTRSAVHETEPDRFSSEQFGSISSLASSTSLISQQELAQLVEEASSLEDARGPHDVVVVLLHKENPNGSVGITLAGGVDCEAKEITVHRVLAHSIADKDGRVQRGDRILSINGRSTRGLNHRESLAVLKQPRSEIVLVVSRSRNEEGPRLRSRTESVETIVEGSEVCGAADNTAWGPPTRVAIFKDGAGLGFSLAGGRDSPLGDRPLVIKKIFTGGAAEKTAALTAGDQLLEVNGIDVTRMARIEAWSLMKKLSDGEANLLVRHPATKSS